MIDEARSGRPSTAVTDVNIAEAAELLENDRRLTVCELLAPCDFCAFPTLKRQLHGKRFSSDDDEVRNATAAVLKGMSQNNLFHVFESFIKRCKKCIQCEGRYFEKEKNVGPLESSDSE